MSWAVKTAISNLNLIWQTSNLSKIAVQEKGWRSRTHSQSTIFCHPSPNTLQKGKWELCGLSLAGSGQKSSSGWRSRRTGSITSAFEKVTLHFRASDWVFETRTGSKESQEIHQGSVIRANCFKFDSTVYSFLRKASSNSSFLRYHMTDSVTWEKSERSSFEVKTFSYSWESAFQVRNDVHVNSSKQCGWKEL